MNYLTEDPLWICFSCFIQLEPVMIIEACITKPEKNSLTIDQFCNRTLQAIQQGVGSI
jgi:hypothetical protein